MVWVYFGGRLRFRAFDDGGIACCVGEVTCVEYGYLDCCAAEVLAVASVSVLVHVGGVSWCVCVVVLSSCGWCGVQILQKSGSV